MQRRGQSGQPTKVRPGGPKAGKAPTARASTADLQDQLDRRTRELEEALQYQTATSEVLGIIRRSPADAQPVFDAIVQSAVRLCGAIFGVVYLYDGDRVRIAATNNFTPAATNQLLELQQLKRPERTHLGGRAILDCKVIHVHDVLADPEYSRELALAGGWRAVLAVPLLREGKPVGALSVAKAEPVPFSDRQIQLLNTFADQALIAIENVRLFGAEQARTRELSEALEQQTATSEVLKVISSSLNDLKPVFETIGQRAEKLCETEISVVSMVDGNMIRLASINGIAEEGVEALRRTFPLRLDDESVTARAVRTCAICHVPDVLTDSQYAHKDVAQVSGDRACVAVPVIRDGQVIGAIFVARKKPGFFADAQVALLKTFADQAVIAIENTRLLNELRESLQQQTATSEILEVISNSPTDSQPAFDAIVRSGLKLFPDAAIMVALPDGNFVKGAAIVAADPADVEALRARFPIPLSREFITSTAILDRREIDLPDARDAPTELSAGARNFLASGYRAMTVMPMMRGESAIGTLNVMRRKPGPLSDKQRGLLRTFASQAVIAIENTRLFTELRESLQQQTATADVLKVNSRSTFDLHTVLQTLVESAAHLCRADRCAIRLVRDGSFHHLAAYGYPPEHIKYMASHPVLPSRASFV